MSWEMCCFFFLLANLTFPVVYFNFANITRLLFDPEEQGCLTGVATVQGRHLLVFGGERNRALRDDGFGIDIWDQFQAY